MLYVIDPAGRTIECFWTTEGGQDLHSTNTVGYGSTIEFAAWLSQQADWEWDGQGFSFSIHVRTGQEADPHAGWQCRLSALAGNELVQKLPAAFYA